MRSWLLVLVLLGLAAVAPSALASDPAEDLLEAVDLGEPGSIVDQVHAAREAAEEAAGVRDGSPPLDAPLLIPAPGAFVLPDLAVAGLALAGLASMAFSVIHGGARFVTPAEVLQNPVRQRIYDHLKQNTGANLKEVTDALGLTTTNAIWHLRKLEEAGLIHSRRFNGYKVFYPADGGIEARRLSLGKTALSNDNAHEVFEHVVLHPGSHQREIARALGVNHGTVRWHLKKLLDAELIVETRKGKASSYAPTPVGLQALRKINPKEESPRPAPLLAA